MKFRACMECRCVLSNKNSVERGLCTGCWRTMAPERRELLASKLQECLQLLRGERKLQVQVREMSPRRPDQDEYVDELV